jgi:hypothetical protein
MCQHVAQRRVRAPGKPPASFAAATRYGLGATEPPRCVPLLRAAHRPERSSPRSADHDARPSRTRRAGRPPSPPPTARPRTRAFAMLISLIPAYDETGGQTHRSRGVRSVAEDPTFAVVRGRRTHHAASSTRARAPDSAHAQPHDDDHRFREASFVFRCLRCASSARRALCRLLFTVPVGQPSTLAVCSVD